MTVLGEDVFLKNSDFIVVRWQRVFEPHKKDKAVSSGVLPMAEIRCLQRSVNAVFIIVMTRRTNLRGEDPLEMGSEPHRKA